MKCTRSIPALVLATGVMLGGSGTAANAEGAVAPQASPPPNEAESPQPSAPSLPTTPPTEAAPGKPKGASLTNVRPFQQVALKPEHVILAGLTGPWKTDVHLFSGPFPREMDVKGTAEGKLLMGGLFVQVDRSEKKMKQPFEAMMIYGFDETIGKYTSDRLQTTSSAIIHNVGTYDAAKKQLVLSSHYTDQKSRALTIERAVTTFVDANTWTYEEYISHGVGQKETKTLSITFKRPS